MFQSKQAKFCLHSPLGVKFLFCWTLAHLIKNLELKPLFLVGVEVRAFLVPSVDVQKTKREESIQDVEHENTIFGDMLLGDFDDSFQNLSLKVSIN